MRKKQAAPAGTKDLVKRFQVNVKLSALSMTQLKDLHHCLDLDQTMSTLAGDILSHAIAKAHKELPLYSD